MHFKKFIVWLSSPILLGRLEARKEEGGADKGKDAMNRSRKNVPCKREDISAGAGCLHLEVVTAAPFESSCFREWS